jgi:predicted ribosomally synthesized peptide with nif11-like leader
MPASTKLLFKFDASGLRSDLERVAPDIWVPHFNKDYFEGDWSGVALRSTGGVSDQLYSNPSEQVAIADTPMLDRCPNVRAVLASLECKLKSVRFLKLAAGSTIQEHRDYDLRFDLDQARLHIPIITNPEVVFFVDAQRVDMKEGECWYLDLSLPHWVENHGETDRVHLVIDCQVNDWLSDLIVEDGEAAIEPLDQISSPDALERFRETVRKDPALQSRLRATSDRESFIRLAVSVARDAGFQFNAADVEHAMESARREWYETWIR